MKNKYSFILCVLCIGWSIQLNAQLKFKFGIRAGTTISSVFGPSEKDELGNDSESNKFAARISAGGTVFLPLTERFGLGAEVLFSQKGSLYRFEADNAYLKLTGSVASPNTNQLFTGKQKIYSMNVTNGYVEIPFLVYFYPVKDRLMIDFGPSVSFLFSSTALGIIKYGIIDPINPNPSDFLEIQLDYKLLKDGAGGFAENAIDKTGRLDQTTINYPSTIGGYYFFDDKKGPLFNIVDFGLNAGISYFFTKGLRVGARCYYGISDITNDDHDIDQRNLDTNNNYLYRKDRDINFGIQLFLGLQF